MLIKNDKLLEFKRDQVRKYLLIHPTATTKAIKEDLKIKIERIYPSLKKAYFNAGLNLPKHLSKRSRLEQELAVVEYLKSNPLAFVPEIRVKTGVNVNRVFGSIRNAYFKAGLKYPEKKLSSGIRNPDVFNRSFAYERKIILLLKKLGQIKRNVYFGSFRIDGILSYKNKIYVVEIKDFRGRNNITMSQIKQLLFYMKLLNIKNGLLVCPKQSFPKRKNTLKLNISGSNIWIISEEDILAGLTILK